MNGLSAVAPRPMKNGCHGTKFARNGMPLASHWSAAGLTVSGLDEATIMSTFSLKIRSWVTSATRLGLDWVVELDDLDRVLLAVAADDAVADGFEHVGDDPLVRTAEGGQRRR